MKIEIMNPWWASKRVPKELAPEFKRNGFEAVKKLLNVRQIVALCGLRRTGKTTILYQIIKSLINEGVNPENILYYSFDASVENLDDVLESYASLFKKDLLKEKVYFFFDEVQKLDDWQNKLKLLYDLHPKVKIFVSGSASLRIEKRGKESLAGRIYFEYIYPLSFKEWLSLRGIKIEKPYSIYESKIRPLLSDYIKTALPEIANLDSALAVKYIKEGIIDNVVFKDIPEEFKDAEHTLLLDLLDIFYSNPGEILNIDSLARELKRSKTTISNHIFYLKFSMLIRIVKNYRGNVHSASRKMPKVYPYHPLLCIGYEVELPTLIENAVISNSNAKFYWREKEKEVDLVVDGIPIEVKYRRRIRESDYQYLKYFMKKFNVSSAKMITISEKGRVGKIENIPAWLFLLERVQND